MNDRRLSKYSSLRNTGAKIDGEMGKAVAAVRRRRASGPAPKTPKEDRYFSRAVSKALEVLEILKRSPEPQALHQLTSKVELTKSSLFRILHTLEMAGYIEKTSDGRYVISIDRRPLIPTSLLTRLLRIARPHLSELTREFRESTALGALFDNHIEVMTVVESPQIVRMGNTPGNILQPHASAIGKSITAFQTEERRERLLRSYGILRMTPRTITDETLLHEEFRRVREQGYALDSEETTVDGQCFGAPITINHGEVLAAISMSLPTSRVGTAERKQQLIAAVTRTARAISNEWSA
jgi:DNA-binding IclR family transcriptional regulator